MQEFIVSYKWLIVVAGIALFVAIEIIALMGESRLARQEELWERHGSDARESHQQVEAVSLEFRQAYLLALETGVLGDVNQNLWNLASVLLAAVERHNTEFLSTEFPHVLYSDDLLVVDLERARQIISLDAAKHMKTA